MIEGVTELKGPVLDSDAGEFASAVKRRYSTEMHVQGRRRVGDTQWERGGGGGGGGTKKNSERSAVDLSTEEGMEVV